MTALKVAVCVWLLAVDDSPVRLYAPEIRKPKSEYKVTANVSDPVITDGWRHVDTLVFQDFITDWSPEESSRRLQQGKVSDRLCVCVCVAAASHEHQR